ncbi:MAG: hypothetical protein PHV16_04625, partial [Candidatus Nanoarchaeia archaeon]|nr:hypothetical protein [Candidatus Nanoarchaeia archaeon]
MKKTKKSAAKNNKLKQETKKPAKRKAKNKTESWLRQHTIAIIISVILFLLISGLGTKIFLYLNFILGNDIIIHLDSDKEDLSLIRGQHETINFKSSITTNPFCNAQCSYVFDDISNNKTLDYDDFKLSPGMPITKQYVVSIDDFGEGQKLYRFAIECVGSPSLLCHTKQESTSRNVLVT